MDDYGRFANFLFSEIDGRKSAEINQALARHAEDPDKMEDEIRTVIDKEWDQRVNKNSVYYRKGSDKNVKKLADEIINKKKFVFDKPYSKKNEKIDLRRALATYNEKTAYIDRDTSKRTQDLFDLLDFKKRDFDREAVVQKLTERGVPMAELEKLSDQKLTKKAEEKFGSDYLLRVLRRAENRKKVGVQFSQLEAMSYDDLRKQAKKVLGKRYERYNLRSDFPLAPPKISEYTELDVRQRVSKASPAQVFNKSMQKINTWIEIGDKKHLREAETKLDALAGRPLQYRIGGKKQAEAVQLSSIQTAELSLRIKQGLSDIRTDKFKFKNKSIEELKAELQLKNIPRLDLDDMSDATVIKTAENLKIPINRFKRSSEEKAFTILSLDNKPFTPEDITKLAKNETSKLNKMLRDRGFMTKEKITPVLFSELPSQLSRVKELYTESNLKYSTKNVSRLRKQIESAQPLLNKDEVMSEVYRYMAADAYQKRGARIVDLDMMNGFMKHQYGNADKMPSHSDWILFNNMPKKERDSYIKEADISVPRALKSAVIQDTTQKVINVHRPRFDKYIDGVADDAVAAAVTEEVAGLTGVKGVTKSLLGLE
jgi:hypothetical protein